ncbi:MAG: YciI family protein [Gammaproteobacteria bacterium]
MKFFCFCYYESERFKAMSESDLEAVGRACKPHDEALRESGHLLLVGSLGEPESARTIWAKSDGYNVMDGPYAETREPIGAFFIIEAKDMNEAVEVASKHPGAQLGQYFGGGIEIRPIDQYFVFPAPSLVAPAPSLVAPAKAGDQ